MTFDLLEAVLPTEGRFCILGIGKYTDQRFANTREEADEIIEELSASKVNVYYGCAKYGPLENRKHENVVAIRALWVDIDCGPTKGVPNSKGKNRRLP